MYYSGDRFVFFDINAPIHVICYIITRMVQFYFEYVSTAIPPPSSGFAIYVGQISITRSLMYIVVVVVVVEKCVAAKTRHVNVYWLYEYQQ